MLVGPCFSPENMLAGALSALKTMSWCPLLFTKALWDQLLEGRIKLQKALLTANQLPQPDTFPEFKERGGQEFANALKNSKNPFISSMLCCAFFSVFKGEGVDRQKLHSESI